MELEDYIRELSKVKILAEDEEASLWRAFKEKGDIEARSLLIRSYQPLVFREAMPFRSLENVMDVVQEGTVGLIEAAESYDHGRGVAFSLFAVHRIRGRMLSFLRKESKKALACIDGMADEDGVPVKERIADSALSVPEQAESHELAARLREALLRLPQNERLVLEEMCLCGGEAGAVAQKMNVSVSHVYRLQRTGVRRIRGMLSRFMHFWRG